MKEEYFEKFNNILSNRISTEFQQLHLEGDAETLFDKIKFQKALNTVCENTFNEKRLNNGAPSKKKVPWWTAYLTIRRKKVNAMRRRYQRTKNNNGLRDRRKIQYFVKTKYEVLIRK